jgi:nanoRNase/pAp phosphatase (c-di-AMP/oligoRNAs hydrolase)
MKISMDEVKQEIAKILLEKDNFLVTTFENENIGSIAAVLAMGEILKNFDKNFTLFVVDFPEMNISFLPHIEELKTEIFGKNLIISISEKNKKLKKFAWKRTDEVFEIELFPKNEAFGPEDVSFKYKEEDFEYIIVLGSPRYGAVKELEKFKQKPIINIDFHKDNVFYGQINFVNKKAVSLAEILASLIETLEGISKKQIWSQDLATLLYANLYWLTKGLRGDLPPKVFSVTAQLISYGAKKEMIEEKFEKRFSIEFYSLMGEIFKGALYQNETLLGVLKLKSNEIDLWRREGKRMMREIKNKIFGINRVCIVIENIDSNVNEPKKLEIYLYGEKTNPLKEEASLEWELNSPPFFKGISFLKEEELINLLKQKLF